MTPSGFQIPVQVDEMQVANMGAVHNRATVGRCPVVT